MTKKKVSARSTVKLSSEKPGIVVTYTLVPEAEADLRLGKLSLSSPIATALLGKTVGDQVEIAVPAGTLRFEILGISP